MCVPNLVPIGPETATCIRLERYTHRHTFSYIDIDIYRVYVDSHSLGQLALASKRTSQLFKKLFDGKKTICSVQ